MFEKNVGKFLSMIKSDDLVLDVGGWASPFNRANWMIDAEPYAARGFYGKIGLPKFQGPDKEYFNKDTYVQRDICEKSPWPFKDKAFDFSICSHTLEDLRDPLYVCSELIRVSKSGYIEFPSRVIESCRAVENDKIVGYSHHRWLIDLKNNHLQFTMKYHLIHTDIRLSFPKSYAMKLNKIETISYLFWEDKFTFAETRNIHAVDNIYEFLRSYIRESYTYPEYMLMPQWLATQFDKTKKGIKRYLGRCKNIAGF